MSDTQVHLQDKLISTIKNIKIDNKDKNSKIKTSSKVIPEKQISLYAAVENNNLSKSKKAKNKQSFESPINSSNIKVSAGTTNSSQGLHLSKSKYEAFVPKVIISESQLKSPSSTTYKSQGSAYSKTSSQNNDTNSNKGKNSDFKLKYKTEKCKFWDLYKECKYGDNVSVYIIYTIVCICSWE